MGNQLPKIAIVVDGFSTGKYFAKRLERRGYPVLHIQSRDDIPSFMLHSFTKEHYIDHIIFDGNLENLLRSLKQYQILAVIPGTETAIFLADRLAEALNLPGNPTQSSNIRRNKFDMVNAVQSGNLLTSLQIKTNNLDDIMSWHEAKLQKEWPLVVKPLHSAGTDGVRFCAHYEEVAAAMQNILGKKNRLNIFNEEVLVQSFLDGHEYIVNTVSHASHHHLTDMRLCHKTRVRDAGYISRCEELLDASEPVCQVLKQYAFQALDQLQISQGPGHFEIMMTKNGPAIIEMGARLQGGIDPEANAACIGPQQIDKTIDAYLEPTHFLSYHQEDYALKKFGAWVFLMSEKSGTVESIPFSAEVQKLPSFFSQQIHVQVGSSLARTIDYYSSPGSVHLVHRDKAQLMKDVAEVYKLEKLGFVVS